MKRIISYDSDAEKESIREEHTPGCYVKARYVLALMTFLGRFIIYSLRNSLSVTIVAMVKRNSTQGSSVSSTNNYTGCPDRGSSSIDEVTSNGVFAWNSAEQGLLLGCYFYGYVITCIPGGYLAKRFGVRIVLGLSMLLSSVLWLLFPVMAYASFELVVASRILIGFLQGVSFPAMQSAWGIWAPPLERSKLLSLTWAGSSFGTFVTLPFTGVIADQLGWEAVFYITGAASLLWSVVWLGIIHSTPESHPRISEQEKTFIVESVGIQRRKNPDQQTRTPWLAMLTSLPLWGAVTGHFASNWGNYTLMAMLPTYMATILKYNLSAVGGLSSLPYILQFFFTLGGGYVTDFLRSRRIMSTVAVRKMNTTLGLLVPAIFMVLAGYIGCDVAAAVSFFSISVAFNALTASGCKNNCLDIAPKYSGVAYGLSNMIGNVPGFLAPQVVGIMLLSDDSLEQWQNVFWMAAAVYTAGAIFYLAVASGEEQPWARGKIVEKSTYAKEKEANDHIRMSTQNAELT